MIGAILQARAAITASKAADLSPGACLVLYALASHTDRHTGTTKVGAATLAAETNMHRSSVLRAMGQLEALGLIAGRRRFGQSTVWTVPMAGPKLSTTARPGRAVDNPQPRALGAEPRAQGARTARPGRAYQVSVRKGSSARTRHPALGRCPERIGWKLCDDDCATCGGTGHAAVAT